MKLPDPNKLREALSKLGERDLADDYVRVPPDKPIKTDDRAFWREALSEAEK